MNKKEMKARKKVLKKELKSINKKLTKDKDNKYRIGFRWYD